jgi:hypothetical protein
LFKLHYWYKRSSPQKLQKYTGAPTLHCFVNLMTLSQIFLATCVSRWKLKILLSKGQELYKYWINPQANTKVHKYTCWPIFLLTFRPRLEIKYFLRYAWRSWKLQIYMKSRAITLTKLKKIHIQNPRCIASQWCWSLFL